MDSDGSGELEIDELQKALESLCYNEVKAQEILAKFELMDADGSGSIDFEEFASVMTSEETGAEEMMSLEEERGVGIQHQAFYEFATTYRREMLLEQIEYESGNDVEPYSNFEELFSLQLVNDKAGVDESGALAVSQEKARSKLWREQVRRNNEAARTGVGRKDGKGGGMGKGGRIGEESRKKTVAKILKKTATEKKDRSLKESHALLQKAQVLAAVDKGEPLPVLGGGELLTFLNEEFKNKAKERMRKPKRPTVGRRRMAGALRMVKEGTTKDLMTRVLKPQFTALKEVFGGGGGEEGGGIKEEDEAPKTPPVTPRRVEWKEGDRKITRGGEIKAKMIAYKDAGTARGQGGGGGGGRGVLLKKGEVEESKGRVKEIERKLKVEQMRRKGIRRPRVRVKG
ncbi:hypothetical protein TrCOL_g2679 [Triparma columacea]|uniref:EF-hand domain-containing protein n=1 Tax=Triparma columacea TaxID=722753 RepID=A0A9W7GEQ1_9STRA|nr:hypothetical protein TrCOL_g2679 [Triparma columacea]